VATFGEDLSGRMESEGGEGVRKEDLVQIMATK